MPSPKAAIQRVSTGSCSGVPARSTCRISSAGISSSGFVTCSLGHAYCAAIGRPITVAAATARAGTGRS